MYCFQKSNGSSGAAVKAVANVIGMGTCTIFNHHLAWFFRTRKKQQVLELVYTTANIGQITALHNHRQINSNYAEQL